MCTTWFDDLLKRVSPYVKHAKTHRTPISTMERLALTLRVLACGATQQSVAETFKIGPSTARKIVAEMCKTIWMALKDEFVTALSQTRWETIATDFWGLWNFPNCIGAIDGKHVLVRAPARSGSLYFNYKGTHSIVLLAVCDAQYKFTMVDIGAYGRESDGGKNLTSAQRVYNYRHCRARRIIENSFGIMASRFWILGRPIESSVEKAVNIVQACVALHNYLISTDVASAEKARYITPNLADVTTPTGEVRPGDWRGMTEADHCSFNLLNWKHNNCSTGVTAFI
ncbi:hypothetical protein QQF64_007921 [Cirrhinus molitorella]|uniref:DDE Tnp4 domain-containing protein n=1 Tax=Cirrhinus molitorella TaxID=172907 RepID=A0ABR3M7S4_9TELE